MQTPFNPQKAAHAAALFLRLRGHSMSYLKLIKLLYLLDREALERWERPVCGGKYVSMKLGPVLSEVRDLIVWEQPRTETDPWHELIRTKGFEVELKTEVEPESLSRREIELIHELFNRFGKMSRWDLAEFTHNLPEWKKPPTDNSTCPLEFEDVMQAIGKGPDEATALGREINSIRRVSSLAGCA
jgi:uncharacterized phage-associated protein